MSMALIQCTLLLSSITARMPALVLRTAHIGPSRFNELSAAADCCSFLLLC
jgi:hypothetical protein